MKCLCQKAIAHINFDIGKVNAFAKSDIEDFKCTIESLAFPEVRIIILESHKISPSGFAIFCAGANQKERVGWSKREILDHLEFQRSVIHQLRLIPQTVVSCVNGLALGLGVEICLASDCVCASPQATFGFPEKSIGIIPGAGGYAWAHGWSIHPEAAQHYIESGMLFARDAASWLGIVDIPCDEEDFDLEIQYLTGIIFSHTPEEQMELKIKYHEKIDYKKWFEFEQKAYEEALNHRDPPNRAV